MRTSSSQFQLLVEYMERNGDLSKPTEGPNGKITNHQRWAELTQLLNADATGATKTPEKWRKVWSDFKNNTKKKAARIHRAARGTGGGPAYTLTLSNLEERALNLVGTQSATGIVTIPEVGLEDEVTEPPPPSDIAAEDSIWSGTSSQPPIFFPPMHVGGTNERGLGLVSNGTPEARDPATDAIRSFASPTDLHAVESAPSTSRTGRRRISQSPTPLPHTPRRRRRAQNNSSPVRRRTRTQTQSELARQAFVRSDCEWRAFQQETERERNRIREEEIAIQNRWLDILSQFVALGNRFADILEKK